MFKQIFFIKKNPKTLGLPEPVLLVLLVYEKTNKKQNKKQWQNSVSVNTTNPNF